MKRSHLFSVVASAILTSWATAAPAQEVAAYFSPDGGAGPAIVATIDAAKTSIDIAAYQLTAAPIGAAIDRAKTRGVRVRVILDANQDTPETDTPNVLAKAGLAMRTDRREKLFHNKYAVIDNSTTITGSYNWSDNAEKRNAENVVIINDAATAARFAANFAKHWEHSAPFSTERKAHPNKKPRRPNHLPPFTPPTTKEP